MSMGNFPEIVSQQILVGIFLVGRLGVHAAGCDAQSGDAAKCDINANCSSPLAFSCFDPTPPYSEVDTKLRRGALTPPLHSTCSCP